MFKNKYGTWMEFLIGERKKKLPFIIGESMVRLFVFHCGISSRGSMSFMNIAEQNKALLPVEYCAMVITTVDG